MPITGPVYFKGNNLEGFSSFFDDYYQFVIEENKPIKASGSIMSFIDNGSSNIDFIPKDSTFISLFKDCKGLIEAPSLPALRVSDSCYRDMFNGCTNLISAPDLPAKTMRTSCYEDMFQGCVSLVKAPDELPATELEMRCYA